jgi:hypothetical protein
MKNDMGSIVVPASMRGLLAQPPAGLFSAGGQQPERKSKFFGQGGAGRNIAGALGDALMQMGGLRPLYAPAMEHQREMQMREAERQRDSEDWFRREQWKMANSGPKNDTEADYQFLTEKLGPEAAKEFLRNKADPPQWRQGPDGRFYRIETAPTPTAPVGKLTPIPDGGPTPPASGGFRR